MANRAILGEFDGDYVLRVSRPGHNVLNPSLARKNLAFDSRWPEVLNVHATGSVGLNSSGVSIPHGLGSAYSTWPVCLAWIEHQNRMYQITSSSIYFNGGYWRMTVNDTHLIIGRGTSGTSTASTLHYVILRAANG